MPKASLTYTSPSLARPATKSSWIFCCSAVSFLSGFFLALSGMVSPALKRTFSSRATSPGLSAATKDSAAGPTTSLGPSLTGLPKSSPKRTAQGLRLPSGSKAPSGRPRWLISTSLPPWSSTCLMLGSAARIRRSSVILPPFKGTLKSTRMSTVLPLTLMSARVLVAMVSASR